MKTLDEVCEISEKLGPLAIFGSVDDDGTPHMVPVIASWWEQRLVFGSRAGSLKVRNLANRSNASVHFATPGETFPDALLLKGHAEVVVDDHRRQVLWSCGRFPYLPSMYSGPTDDQLRFVEFTPWRAVIVRNGGQGPVERWAVATEAGADAH